MPRPSAGSHRPIEARQWGTRRKGTTLTEKKGPAEDPDEPKGRPNPEDDPAGPKDEDETVDEQSADSFPSSDPPAW
jgi:hypothetical protein